MTEPTWLCEAAYAYLDDLSPSDLSWEFLRRNPDYQHDFEHANPVGASSEDASADGRIRAWGLAFLGRSNAFVASADGVLATGP